MPFLRRMGGVCPKSSSIVSLNVPSQITVPVTLADGVLGSLLAILRAVETMVDQVRHDA